MSDNAKSVSIYKKIAKVMQDIQKVPKNGRNDFHKYNYVTESDLLEHIRPILLKAGLAFFTTVEEQERDGEFTKVKMKFTLVDTESGETLESVFWGEGQDKGDKGLYKAYTGATKYFLMKTFLIPTGDDPEADASVDERNYGAQSAKKPGNTNAPQAKPITPQLIGVIKTTWMQKGFELEKLDAQLKRLYNKTLTQLTMDEANGFLKKLQTKPDVNKQPAVPVNNAASTSNDNGILTPEEANEIFGSIDERTMAGVR